MISEKWQSHAESAAKLISHRGPDDYGIYREDPLCLIHYRLSILDVSVNGHQPMISDDGRYVIILNGEIYNHLEIRDNLQHHHFKSTSDTETLLYAYSEKGTAIFPELNGIFALAIYDKQEKELIVARDHIGIKPLYYHHSKSGFVFSSELKSIAALPEMDKTLNVEALSNYIQFIYSPGKSTPFKSINKLEPGHFIKLSIPDFKIIEFKKYYQIPFTGNYLQENELFWIDTIDQALQKSVKRQLLSDVPVGYFISGGLDSSLIAAIAKKINPDIRLKGFTIQISQANKKDGFADDYPYACQLADLLGIDLEVVDGQVDLPRDLDDMIWHQDEPQAEISSLYVSSIAKIARANGIYVLLSGLGGDDLFAGYRRHQAVLYDRYLYKVPFVFRNFVAKFVESFPVKTAPFRRLKKFLSKFKEEQLCYGLVNYYKWLQDDKVFDLFTDEYKKELLNFDSSTVFLDSLKSIPKESDPLNQMLFWEMNYYLPDHNLNCTDKLSMKHGVEVRVPFCDPDLVKLSTLIPPELKVKNGISKYLLKKVAERYLPNDLIYRPKTGFGGPIRKWITEDFKEIVNDKLSKQALSQFGIFEYDKVRKLIDENIAGKIDASYSIFSLLAIQSWMKTFLK